MLKFLLRGLIVQLGVLLTDPKTLSLDGSSIQRLLFVWTLGQKTDLRSYIVCTMRNISTALRVRAQRPDSATALHNFQSFQQEHLGVDLGFARREIV